MTREDGRPRGGGHARARLRRGRGTRKDARPHSAAGTSRARDGAARSADSQDRPRRWAARRVRPPVRTDARRGRRSTLSAPGVHDGRREHQWRVRVERGRGRRSASTAPLPDAAGARGDAPLEVRDTDHDVARARRRIHVRDPAGRRVRGPPRADQRDRGTDAGDEQRGGGHDRADEAHDGAAGGHSSTIAYGACRVLTAAGSDSPCAIPGPRRWSTRQAPCGRSRRERIGPGSSEAPPAPLLRRRGRCVDPLLRRVTAVRVDAVTLRERRDHPAGSREYDDGVPLGEDRRGAARTTRPASRRRRGGRLLTARRGRHRDRAAYAPRRPTRHRSSTSR